MNESPLVFESEILVRFPDCDPFNHLNNSKYLDYFFNAREDHLLDHGFNIYQVAMEKGLGWVVILNQIAYLRPARLNERVIIQSTLLQLKEKEVLIEMRMWNQDRTVLKSLLWSQCIHYNSKTQRAEIHSPELIQFFTPFENPLPKVMNFEERLADIKNKTDTGIR